MIELALRRRHVQLILSSFKKKAWTPAKCTETSKTLYMCKQTDDSFVCIRVLFKNCFVWSQSDDHDHDHHPAGLGDIAWWYIGLEPPKRFLGFFKPTGVCRWKVLPALSATELGFVGLSTACQLRSAVVLQTKERKPKKVSISPWEEDGGDGSMVL
jgi:hypothetical protein